MTTIYDDPTEFAEDATAGFVDLYSDRLRQVTGGVVRRGRPHEPKVAVIVGGGSGHYPAFAGLVGPGFADAAVMGNVFTSPSTAQAYAVGKAADSGRGVIYAYGNYAGDVLNFTQAGDRLRAEGVEARQLIVTDDVASATADEVEKRRGIAGDLVVFKVAAAAAEKGLDIDEVMRLGELANDRTFTLGVAFSGCSFPGAEEPLFTVPEGKMGLGLGIHGEPGLRDVDWVPADELAGMLVDRLLEERPEGVSGRVAVIVNGLGATKYEELFLLYGRVARRLRDAGLEIVAPEVGELVTSLNMGGVSLTLTWLDDELEELWLAPADAPAFRRGSVDPGNAFETAAVEADATTETVAATGSEESRAAASTAVAALAAMRSVLEREEEKLGRLDSYAGDGDHGRGMVRGVRNAHDAAERALASGWGAAGVLEAAGDAWGEHAGGTSGALWGAAVRALGTSLGNEAAVDRTAVAAAARAFVDAVVRLGKAEPGDKTLVDAARPFVDALDSELGAGKGLRDAWTAAAGEAGRAAEATADLSPRKGRARPLAERSVGHPDPGAVSFAMAAEAVATVLGTEPAAN